MGEILRPDQKFGDYSVIRCLNFGFLGGLYLMRASKGGEICTMAVLPMVVNTAPNFVNRFRQQIRELRELEHAGILKVTGSGKIEGRFCIIYEALTGVMLDDYLRIHNGEPTSAELQEEEKNQEGEQAPRGAVQPEKSKEDEKKEEEGEEAAKPKKQTEAPQKVLKGIPPEETQEILRQVGETLKAAHAKGIHHYNLVPANIFLTDEGIVKVAGYGLIEMIGPELFEKIVSAGIPPFRVGALPLTLDTVDFLAPEARKGEEPDARADLFALGLNGVYLLSARKPSGQFQATIDLPGGIEVGWKMFLQKCTHGERDQRYATPEAMLTELARIQELRPERVPPQEKFKKTISQIPLPEKVAAKFSDAMQLRIRLGVLGVFALLVIGIASLSFNVIMTDSSQGPKTGSRVLREQNPDRANAILQILPKEASVTIRRGGSGRFLVVDGQLLLRMPAGEYRASIEAKGYRTAEVSLNVTGQPLTDEILLSPDYATLEVIGPPGATLMTVTPAGTRRYIDTLPGSGELLLDNRLLARDYNFRLEAEGFEPQIFPDITLTRDETYTLEANLEARPGSLTIRSWPDGIEVAVDGQVVGSTPLEVGNAPTATPLEVTVVDPRYRPMSKSITLAAGQAGVLDFGAVERRAGTVQLWINLAGGPLEPEEYDRIEVTFEGETFRFDGMPIAQVPEGSGLLQIKHPDYFPFEETIEIRDGAETEVAAFLRPRPGKVKIQVEPAVPFRVFVSGQSVPVQDGVVEVQAGVDHVLQLMAHNYLVPRWRENLAPNEEITRSIRLEPIPSPEKAEPWTIPYLGAEMNWLKPGSYMKGSPLTEQARLPTEGSRRGGQVSVTLTYGLWMSRHEITQKVFEQIMGSNPSTYEGENKPVDSVPWTMAMEFCKRLTEVEAEAGRLPEGYVYRLPLQTEWEYACRAGTTTPFSFGEEADYTMGNFKGSYPRQAGTTGIVTAESYGTTPVGKYEPNAWGFYDMHGNVREWCYAPYDDRLPESPVVDWKGAASGRQYPVRGGSWKDSAHRCRSAAREGRTPSIRADDTGFRIVLAPAIP